MTINRAKRSTCFATRMILRKIYPNIEFVSRRGYPLTSFLRRPECYAVVQPRDTLSRSSADRFDTKSPMCQPRPLHLLKATLKSFSVAYVLRSACVGDVNPPRIHRTISTTRVFIR